MIPLFTDAFDHLTPDERGLMLGGPISGLNRSL
jgi:hypothetical protein